VSVSRAYNMLGNSNGARALKGKETGNRQDATDLRSILDDIRAQGITSIRKIADELNRRDIIPPRGGEWHPTTVVQLLARLSVA
jgi:recombinase